MEKLSKRILIKICSTRPYQWVMRKILIAIMRRTAKAPEVQERIKALQAAPSPEERFYAHFEAMVAMGNEAAKKKWVKFNEPSPEVMQMMHLQTLLPKIESGRATASDIEEFRRWAEELMRDPQCPAESKKRIGDALASIG